MMHTSHLLSGAAAGVWLGVAVSPGPGLTLVGAAVGAVSALAPDIDHPKARGVRALGPIGWVLCRLVRLLSLMTTGRKHRGLSHSLAFAVLVGGLIAWVSSLVGPPETALYLGVSGLTGVVAALLGDLITRAGLSHLLWPSRRQVSVPHWLRLKTNGRVERCLILPAVAVATVAGLVVSVAVSPGAVV